MCRQRSRLAAVQFRSLSTGTYTTPALILIMALASVVSMATGSGNSAGNQQVRFRQFHVEMIAVTTFISNVNFMYVERLVSSQNLIDSNMRASLSQETLNDFLFVKESMGPVAILIGSKA